MQAKESVEIDGRELSSGRARNCDCRAHSVISLLAMRHHNVQAVRSAALEKHDQALLAAGGSGTVNSAREKAGDGRRPNHSHCPAFQKCSSRNRHSELLTKASIPISAGTPASLATIPRSAADSVPALWECCCAALMWDRSIHSKLSRASAPTHLRPAISIQNSPAH